MSGLGMSILQEGEKQGVTLSAAVFKENREENRTTQSSQRDAAVRRKGWRVSGRRSGSDLHTTGYDAGPKSPVRG